MPDIPAAPAETSEPPLLSVVVPVLNESGNVGPLIDEIRSALVPVCRFEIVFVDDRSTDGTGDAILAKQGEGDDLRVIRHSRRAGQSAALRSGVSAAAGSLIVTLDGDGQNDPADIPTLLDAWHAATKTDGRDRAVMVTGHRVNRRDTWTKRQASRIANALRGSLLGDDNPDTGCSLKLYQRTLFLRLPYFDHMHRFLPALAKREGAQVIVVPVNHRPRQTGTSKYRIFDRLAVGIPDLLGVMWLMRRAHRDLTVGELTGGEPAQRTGADDVC